MQAGFQARESGPGAPGVKSSIVSILFHEAFWNSSDCGQLDAGTAKQANELGQIQRHQAGMVGASSRLQLGLPIPASPEGFAGKAGFSFPAKAKSDLRAWVLLAWAQVSPWADAEVTLRLLAGEDCAESSARR
jgi:hypothetical protein